ncbi:MAG: hypothetical protein AB1938_06170 [Myxococcota bacterium]
MAASSAMAEELSKEEAQRKVDQAMARSCTLAKAAITRAGDVCADEKAKMAAVDCAKKETRKGVDFLALNGTCQKKVREAVKAKGDSAKKNFTADAEADTKTDKRDERDEKYEEFQGEAEGSKVAGPTSTTCRAVDSGGATVAEVTSEGTPIKCSGVLREKVKAQKCEPGKQLEFQLFARSRGKEQKPSTLKVTCP